MFAPLTHFSWPPLGSRFSAANLARVDFPKRLLESTRRPSSSRVRWEPKPVIFLGDGKKKTVAALALCIFGDFIAKAVHEGLNVNNSFSLSLVSCPGLGLEFFRGILKVS
jgi:hypothetical protein